MLPHPPEAQLPPPAYELSSSTSRMSNAPRSACGRPCLHSSLVTRVGDRLNLNDLDSDSAYQFRFLLIPNFDSNKVKKINK